MKEKHYCLQCGKEIPSWKKFCNSSCAATYNNLKRGRGRKWSEEKKLAVKEPRVKQYCKYCGKETGLFSTPFKKLKGCCDDCRPYVQRLDVIDKIAGSAGTLKDRYENSLKILEKLYFTEKKNLSDISRIYKINKSTVRQYLYEAGKQTRTIADGIKTSLEQKRRQNSHNCSEKYNYKSGSHLSWEGKLFHYRSSWEEKYMQELDRKKIPYEYEFAGIRYYNSLKGEECIAFPDFYLPKTNEIVEIKSNYTLRGKVQEMKDKFKRYKEIGFKPVLLLDWM